MEIKPESLRIGNLMKEHYTGKIISVIELTEKSFTFSDSFIGKWQAEALEISEEILLKVGFEYDQIEERFKFYGTNDCEYILEQQDDWWFIGVKHSNSINYFVWDIKYAHQLQNLYFALTGEELDVSKLI